MPSRPNVATQTNMAPRNCAVFTKFENILTHEPRMAANPVSHSDAQLSVFVAQRFANCGRRERVECRPPSNVALLRSQTSCVNGSRGITMRELKIQIGNSGQRA